MSSKPPSPDYVPGPEHDDDEIVAEDQPYAEDASPIAQSPDYVPESDPEADPEEDGDEDPEEEEEDEDDDMDIEADEEDEDDEMDVEIDEEEHPPPPPNPPPPHIAPATTVVVALPAISHILRRRLSHLDRYYLLYLPPPASPLSSWAYHTTDSCPIISTSTSIDNTTSSPVRAMGYRACYDSDETVAEATSHSIYHYQNHLYNLPHQSSSLHWVPRYKVGESSAAAAARPAGGLRADYGFVATMDRQIRRDPERYVGYGITDSWDEMVETLPGAPVSTDTELGAHMREFESMVRRDTDEIYTRLDDVGGTKTVIGTVVNMLFRDRRGHAHTRQLMETEAGMSREAWGRAMDASDLAHGEVISLRTTVHAQMSEITELQSADHRRQRAISDLLETDRRRREEMRELRAADRTRQQQIIQTLTVMQTLQREMIPLQGLVTTLQGQVTALQGQVMTLQGQVTALQGQQGPAGGLAQPELPEEAGSSS
ncbi:hypothetical protein Tco_1484498 [Tanacetum coccineum]